MRKLLLTSASAAALLVSTLALPAGAISTYNSEPAPERAEVGAFVALWDGAESADALIGRADAALYDAKRTGRDRAYASERSAEPVPSAPGAIRWGGAPLARGA